MRDVGCFMRRKGSHRTGEADGKGWYVEQLVTRPTGLCLEIMILKNAGESVKSMFLKIAR